MCVCVSTWVPSSNVSGSGQMLKWPSSQVRDLSTRRGSCWVAKRVAAGARTSDVGRYSCGVKAMLSTSLNYDLAVSIAMGYPNSWMVYNEKITSFEMDDNWGYPYDYQFRKPPYGNLIHSHGKLFCLIGQIIHGSSKISRWEIPG